jgi:hypothetical protein
LEDKTDYYTTIAKTCCSDYGPKYRVLISPEPQQNMECDMKNRIKCFNERNSNKFKWNFGHNFWAKKLNSNLGMDFLILPEVVIALIKVGESNPPDRRALIIHHKLIAGIFHDWFECLFFDKNATVEFTPEELHNFGFINPFDKNETSD